MANLPCTIPPFAEREYPAAHLANTSLRLPKINRELQCARAEYLHLDSKDFYAVAEHSIPEI